MGFTRVPLTSVVQTPHLPPSLPPHCAPLAGGVEQLSCLVWLEVLSSSLPSPVHNDLFLSLNQHGPQPWPSGGQREDFLIFVLIEFAGQLEPGNDLEVDCK